MGAEKSKEIIPSGTKEEISQNFAVEKLILLDQYSHNSEIQLLCIGRSFDHFVTLFTCSNEDTFRKLILQKCIGLIIHLISECKDHADQNILSRDRTYSQMVNWIIELWKEEAIQKTFEQLCRLKKVEEDAACWFANLEKTPSIDDLTYKDLVRFSKEIILCENSILESVHEHLDYRYRFLHQFQRVKMIIFTVPLDGYSKKLVEDERICEMEMSLEMIEEIANNALFCNTALMILFTNWEEFCSEIRLNNIDCLFEDYTGCADPEMCFQFIKKKFEKVVKPREKLFIHLQKEQPSTFFHILISEIKEVMIAENLKALGFDKL